jgi:hypothetical protein
MGGATLAALITGTTGGAGAGVYDATSPGAGSVTIPSGADGVTIECWGAGGGGGYGYLGFIAPGEPEVFPGGGGGGGGYTKTVLSLSGDDGKTINFTVGAGGLGGTGFSPNGEPGTFSNVYSGTFTITTMTSNPGNGGDSGQFAQQGAGGTASGGNTTNTPGNGGAFYTQAGAAGIAGDNSLTAGGGGNGGEFFDGEAGLNGRVRMVFTFP